MSLANALSGSNAPQSPSLNSLLRLVEQGGLQGAGKAPDADHPLFVPTDILACWAKEQGLVLKEAFCLLLDRHIWPERFRRNWPLFKSGDQARLLSANVFVAGCGGLGGQVCLLLARLGVGSFRLCDDDLFAESNLNRQAFCTESALGRPKTEVAARILQDVAGYLDVDIRNVRMTAANAETLVQGCDLALDCLDTLQDKDLLEKACHKAHIPYIHGGVLHNEGLAFARPAATDSCAARLGLEMLYGPHPESTAGCVSALAVHGTAWVMVALALQTLLGRSPADLLWHLDGGLPELTGYSFARA